MWETIIYIILYLIMGAFIVHDLGNGWKEHKLAAIIILLGYPILIIWGIAYMSGQMMYYGIKSKFKTK